MVKARVSRVAASGAMVLALGLGMPTVGLVAPAHAAPVNAAPVNAAPASVASETSVGAERPSTDDAAKAKWRKIKKFCGKRTCAWGKLKWLKTDRTKKKVRVKMAASGRKGASRARTEMKWIVDRGPDSGWGMAVGPCSNCVREYGSSYDVDLVKFKTIRGVKFRTCYLKQSGKYKDCKSTVTYGP